MKVRVIKTPSKALGGSIYDNNTVDPASIINTGYAINNIISGARDIKAGNYNMDHSKDTYTYDTRPMKDRPHDLSYLTSVGMSRAHDLTHDFIYGKPKKNNPAAPNTVINANVGSMQNGGPTNSSMEDPNMQNAYRQIANLIMQSDNDLQKVSSTLLDQDETLTLDDAEAIVQTVYDLMYDNGPTVKKAKEGGMMDQLDLQNQQTGEPFIIEKPIMKDGGQTFVTSQPAYTKKSHNYFGTSNAPARDSYVDNDEITTSVKAVPREDATIEAEKGEYIYSEKGLYKILGKKHYEGGTPLAARGGEFIFSAHKDMSIDPKLQKQAGLKTTSSKSLADNTPAKVLERNVDVKEYNRLKAILQNKKLDSVTKKTAQFMLDKMDEKIKVISQLQESKKQKGPVEIKDQYLEQPEIQNVINEQKQYAHGGLTKYQDAGGVDSTNTENTENTEEPELNLPDYANVSNRLIVLTKPDGTPYTENGRQVSFNLSVPQDIQKYSQAYSWLGDVTGVQNMDLGNGQKFEVYTVPLMDKPQRSPHVNLDTVNVEGKVLDPRWHDFLAQPGNLEAFKKMSPSEQEAMVDLIVEKGKKTPSTGYWDKASEIIALRKISPDFSSVRAVDYDPRFKQSALKLFGVGANGFMDYLGNAFSFPQNTVNYYATGVYENPAETTHRLNLGQNTPFMDPNSTLGGFERFGARYLTDPINIEAGAKAGLGITRFLVNGAKAFLPSAEKEAAKLALTALEAEEELAGREVSRLKVALRKDPTNLGIKTELAAAKKQLKNASLLVDKKSVDAGLYSTNLFLPGYSSINIPTNPIFKNPITNTLAKAAKFSAYAPTTYVYRPMGKAIGWTAGQIIHNPEWVKATAKYVADKAVKTYDFLQQPAIREVVKPLLFSTAGTYIRESNRQNAEQARINQSDLLKSVLLNRVGTTSPSVPVVPENAVSLEEDSTTMNSGASLSEEPVMEQQQAAQAQQQATQQQAAQQQQQQQQQRAATTAARTPITTTELITLNVPSENGGTKTISVPAPKGSKITLGYDIDPKTRKSVPVQYIKTQTGEVVGVYPNPNVKQKHGGTIVSTYAYGGETELPKFQTQGLYVPMSKIDIPEESTWKKEQDIPQGLYSASISGFDPSGKLSVRTRRNDNMSGLYYGDQNIFDLYGGTEKTPGGEQSAFAQGSEGLARMAASMLQQGIDFSNIKSAGDFQGTAYDWRLRNDPNSLRATWEKHGLTRSASPSLRNRLTKNYGVGFTPSNDSYTIDFSKVDPSKMNDVLKELREAYVDNKFGVRSLDVFSSPAEKMELMPMNMKYLEPKDNLEMKTIPQYTPPKKYTLPKLDYDLHNPEKDIALRNSMAYAASMAAIQPRYDIPYRKVSVNEKFRGMSDQPFKNQADTNNYLETKAGRAFGDASSIQKAAAERNRSNMENMFKTYQTNMMGENEVANRNLLRNAENTEGWNKELRDVFRNNQRVDDLVASGRQNLTNKFIANENSRAERKYEAGMQYITGSLPYATTREVRNPDGTYTNITDLPFNNSGINPNWKGYGSTAVNKLSSQKQANDLATGYNAAKASLGNEGLTMDQYINYLKAINGKKEN